MEVDSTDMRFRIAPLAVAYGMTVRGKSLYGMTQGEKVSYGVT